MAYDWGVGEENNTIWLFAIGSLVALVTCVLIGLLYICSRKNQFLSQPVWKTLCLNTQREYLTQFSVFDFSMREAKPWLKRMFRQQVRTKEKL